MLVRTLSDNKNPSFLDDNWKTQKHTRFVVCFVTALCIHAHKRRRRRRRRKTTNDTQNKGASSRHHHHHRHQLYYSLFFYLRCHQMSSTPHDGASSSSSYDEVDLEDMEWDEALKAYTYACPCGDIFRITLEELHDGEEIARCPSCSLILTVVYDPDDLSPLVA